VASSTNDSVIGINPTTGAQLFSVPLDQSTSTSSSSFSCSGPGCGGVQCLVSQSPGLGMHPMEALTSTSNTPPNIVGSPIIAGDGYFYIAYTYQQQSAVSQSTEVLGWGSCGPPAGTISTSSSNSTQTTDTVVHLMLMRVGSDGSSSKIDVKDWESKFMDQSSGTETANCPPVGYCNITSSFQESVSTVGAVPASPLPLQMITNADQGTLLSWEADTPAYCASATSNTQGVPPTCTAQVAAASTFAVATTSGASASTPLAVNIPGQATPLYPALQTQDGSYVGYVGIGPSPGVATQYNMVAFNGSGSTIWSVSNDFPQLTTSDGGVIGSSGITYDNQGSATGQVGNMPIQSWAGSEYSSAIAAVNQVTAPLTDIDGSSFWPQAGGNPSVNGTSIVQCPCLRQSSGTDPGSQLAHRQDQPNDGNQTTYVLLVGDPGLNLGDGRNHNVGNDFNFAAQTLANSLSLSGNNNVITQRVSSVTDFNNGLTTNGTIAGGVYFFGHGGADSHRYSALFPGELAGSDSYNITLLNVGQLSNKNLATGVSITLNACHAGLGGRASIAQLMANQLKRTVYAAPVDMFFSSNSNPHFFNPRSPADANPSGVPTYMVPNATTPLKPFFPQ
jgi:hypothetical protein